MGENPKQQGKRPYEELEHPGPPPPKVAQKQTQQSSSQPSSESQSKDSSSGGSSSGQSSGQKVKGAQPKILNENPPGEHDESVRQHNEEMDRRAEKAHMQVSNEDAQKDKVPPKFWSGECAGTPECRLETDSRRPGRTGHGSVSARFGVVDFCCIITVPYKQTLAVLHHEA